MCKMSAWPGWLMAAPCPNNGASPARNVDFYDVKGDVEALFAPRSLSFQAATHPASHPGRSARILLDGRAIGWIGELHPQWQQQYDLPQSVVWFEIELAALAQGNVPKLADISRFPPVRRDIAVMVDENVNVQVFWTQCRQKKRPMWSSWRCSTCIVAKVWSKAKKALHSVCYCKILKKL